MKVTGPTQFSPPSGAEAADASREIGAKDVGEVGQSQNDGSVERASLDSPSGSSFAEKVSGGRQAEGASSASGVQDGRAISVGDLAQDLRAGKLDPQTAVERILDRVLDQQVDRSAPAGVRETIRAALAEALQSDPLLAEKMRLLG